MKVCHIFIAALVCAVMSCAVSALAQEKIDEKTSKIILS
jgi:hypothetical protein